MNENLAAAVSSNFPDKNTETFRRTGLEPTAPQDGNELCGEHPVYMEAASHEGAAH